MAQHPPRSRAHERLAPTVRQFWRLLEFTRDIDRNEDDSLFAKNGGTIIYVFDENVFEFFIKPQNFSRYAELFHSSIWFESGTSSEHLRRISAQSALVASEYLFSGALPGQKDRMTYMTEWHFAELSHRRVEQIDALREEINALPGNNDKNSVLRSDPALDRSSIDDLTRSDLEHLASRIKDDAALQRFLDARVAARQLVRSDYLAPLHQLKRLGSKEIAGHIVPLAERFRPSQSERDAIGEERRNLLTLLRDEQKQREEAQERLGEEHFGDHTLNRADRTLQNDADALAYISWIARNKLTPKERIVLITGDSLLFDAYRSWYVDQPLGEPFVLRRVSQFAPIINLNDARNDIVDRRELFRATREAVEAALFVFNLSGSGKSRDHLHKGREYLALALSRYRDPTRDPGLAAFLSGLTAEWIEQRRNDFTDLVQLWQQLERFVIGVHHDFIMQRFSTAEQARLHTVVAVGSQEAFVLYLKGLLDELVSGSIRLFFPFAADFIRSNVLRNGAGASRQSRVPIALRLSIPPPPNDAATATSTQGNVRFDDVHSLFALWRERDPAAVRLLDVDSNPNLAQRPDLVYAIAATIALEACEWRDAERFAELAHSADPMIALQDQDLEQSRYESMYLLAVAKRFRIGSLNPTMSGMRVNFWGELLNGAVNILTKCEMHHARKGETRRQIRAISERAAARLFYVCWSAIIPSDEVKSRQVEPFEARMQFSSALADLRRCLELEAVARNVDPIDERRIQFLARLERQYVTNLAAAQVTKHLLAGDPARVVVDGLTSAEIDLVSLRIGQWDAAATATNLPTAAQTDLLAFNALERRDPQDLQRFAEWSRKTQKFDLALDRALANALAKLISHGSSV